jgi:hypothetical protein
MSTKTTIKRIALVAVAALGFGVVSVVPSSAAVLNDTYTLSESTTTVSLGSAASTTLTTAGYFGSANDSITVTVALKTFPTTMTAAQIATSIAAPGVFSDVDTATAYTGGSAGGSSVVNSTTTSVTGVAVAAPKLVSTRSKVTVAATSLPVVGTYTFTLTPSGAAVNVTAVTWTVVVTARPAMTAAATTALATYGYYAPGTVPSRGDWAAWSTTTDALTFTAYANPDNNPDLSVRVIQSNGNTTYPLIAADAVALTATVTSGPGLVAITGENNTYDSTAARGIYAISTTAQVAALGLTQYVYVFSTGAPGLVTVEIKAGSTVVGTKKINFFGNPATITATAAKPVIGAAATAATVTGKVTDASGNAVPDVTVYAVSGTAAAISNSYTSCGASDATGAVSCSLTGVAAGTSAITLTTNASATATTGISSTPVSVRVSDGVATKVDYAFAKDTYAPGEVATITATVSNAAGVMPAGVYTVLTAGVTGNYALTGGPALTVTTTDATGVVKYTVTVPTGVSGDLTLTGTAATGVTATFGKTAIVNAALDAATAATDAASEAIDAANAATDAANAAAEAADAATAAAQDAADAVAALSVSVAAMIDALKKQITSLTNLVIKIQKKVKA